LPNHQLHVAATLAHVDGSDRGGRLPSAQAIGDGDAVVLGEEAWRDGDIGDDHPSRAFATIDGIQGVYPVVFIDAINVKIRDGQVANRSIYVALAVTAEGHRDILGLWAGDGGEGAKHWLRVLSELTAASQQANSSHTNPSYTARFTDPQLSPT
jgi:hypothetical protein